MYIFEVNAKYMEGDYFFINLYDGASMYKQQKLVNLYFRPKHFRPVY